MPAPRVTTVLPGQKLATCALCNLAEPDDGKRFRKFGGKVFVCAHCKPRS